MGEPEAFGRDFGSLMRRLNEDYATRVTEDGDTLDRRSVRRETGATFQREVEALIARHRMSKEVAEYVRHVVREGFEVAFDAMDPTDEALQVRKRGSQEIQAP